MALLGGLQYHHQSASDDRPHEVGFATARTTSDDELFRVLNGTASTARKFSVDLNGRVHAGGMSAGDVLYAGSAVLTGTRRLDGLAIGTANQVLQVNSGATAPEWTSTLTGVTLAGTVSGTPTWASDQAITLSTAAQPNITSVGTLVGITFSGNLTYTATAAAIQANTSDGSDTKGLRLSGGGAQGDARGAEIHVLGNEHATAAGQLIVKAGNVAGSYIEFITGATQRGRFGHAGGLHIGGTFTAPPVDGLRTEGQIVVEAGGIDVTGGIVGTLSTAAQPNITSVGTLTGGELGAGFTTVAVARGGTGLATFTDAGRIPYSTAATTLAALALGASGRWLGAGASAPQWNAPAALTKADDTNVTLTLGGSASTALLNAASVTAGWTGQLAVGRGGTGLSTFTDAGRIPYSTGATTLAALAIGGANTVLTSSGTAPQWSSTLTSVTLSGPTLSGTVSGTPTWASDQAITLSTAAQPNVTSLGTLTGVVLADGNSTTPAVRFSSSTGSGMYWDAGESKISWAQGGVPALKLHTVSTWGILDVVGTNAAIYVDGSQAITIRQTGWGAPTGTADRTTFATSTVTLEDLARRVKAIIDDLTTHGLIGA